MPSLWAEEGDAAPAFPALDRERSVDVVVVGAGIAGLLIAHRLVQDGAEVLVLERGRVAGGVTGNTTAKVTALHGAIYQRLRSGKGPDAAAAYATAQQQGLEHIADLVATLGIACAFTRAPAWTYATTGEGRARVEAEVAAAQAAGLPARFAVPDELPFTTTGGVELPDQAHFQPVAFCRGVAAALPDVCEQTAVTAVDTVAGGVDVRTAAGHRVGANHVVLATHTPIVDPAYLASRMRPSRSYATALDLGDSPVPRGMYLRVESPTQSLRPALRHGLSVLVAGGYGHGVGDADTAEHAARLDAWVRHAFPGATVTDRWSAHDQVPSDGVPFVGRLAPGESRRWVATGFGKWGLTTSAVAAELIADGIAGRPPSHPAAHLFDASRVTASLTRSLAGGSVRITRHFLGDRVGARRRGRGAGADVDPGSDLAPGEGVVVHVRRQATAVCRDDDGTLHRLSARCPHQGCLVGFNTADRTWDCPCHGSRVAPDGSVLQGPATAPLAPVDP
jgi:glycine/D-amino acid oxidase-like deaminating enzyme/nitrite reductase/ring-hydroxylating ferredoxin subunit